MNSTNRNEVKISIKTEGLFLILDVFLFVLDRPET